MTTTLDRKNILSGLPFAPFATGGSLCTQRPIAKPQYLYTNLIYLRLPSFIPV
jgi:hypothetical protein